MTLTYKIFNLLLLILVVVSPYVVAQVPQAVMSPVEGKLIVKDINHRDLITSGDDKGACNHTIGYWTFCQPQNILFTHVSDGGIYDADDTFAWDINLANKADKGLNVYAVADGVVISTSGWGGDTMGQLLIKHTEINGHVWYSGYLHMTSIISKTANNGVVKAGDLIGKISYTGLYRGLEDQKDHLHFAVYKEENNKYVSKNTIIIPRVPYNPGYNLNFGQPILAGSNSVDRSVRFMFSLDLDQQSTPSSISNFKINSTAVSGCNSSSIPRIGGRYWYFECTIPKNQFSSDTELPVTMSVNLVNGTSQSIAGKIYFGSGTYSDVDKNVWANNYVIQGTKGGLFKGIGGGVFSKSTSTPVTRGQVAKLIYDLKIKHGLYNNTTLTLLTSVTNGRFADVTTDHPFFPHIQALRNEGVISSASYFRPDAAITRGEFAKMLVEGLKLGTSKSVGNHTRTSKVYTGDLQNYVEYLNRLYVQVAASNVETLQFVLEPVFTGCEGFSPCDLTKPVTRYEMAKAFWNVYTFMSNGGEALSKTSSSTDISNYSIIGDKYEGTENEYGLPPNQTINAQGKEVQDLGTMRSGETWWIGFDQDVPNAMHYWTADDGLLLDRTDSPRYQKVDFLAPTVSTPKVVNLYHHVMTEGGLVQEHFFSITVQPASKLAISTDFLDFGEVNISSLTRINPNSVAQRSVTLTNESNLALSGTMNVTGTGFAFVGGQTSMPFSLAANASQTIQLEFKAWASSIEFTGKLTISHNATGTLNPLIVSLTGKGVIMPPSVWGYVKDEQGNPVSGAIIRLSEFGGTRKLTTITDAGGHYRIDAQTGSWDLSTGNASYDEHPDYLFILNSNGKYSKYFQIIGGESMQEDFTAKPKDKSIVPEPVILSPANGAKDIPYKPTLRWSPVTAPAGTTVRYFVKWYVGDPNNPTSYGEWGSTTDTFYDVAVSSPNLYPLYNKVFNWCVQANFQPSLPNGKSLSTCTHNNSFQFLPRAPITYATSTANVTATTATLKADWSNAPDSPFTAYWFEYGTSASNLTSRTPTVSISPTESIKAQTVTADITSLVPATTYYFRLVTQGATGLAYSLPSAPNLKSFITTPANGYTISGKVTLGNSTTAIEGVTLKLKDTTIPAVQSNTSGDFVITGLVNGTYTLQASKADYQFDDWTNIRILDPTVSLIRNFNARYNPPTIITPSVEQSNVSVDPTLSWSAVPTATNYNVLIYLNPERSGSFFAHSNVPTNSIKLYNLPKGMKFYWSVLGTYPQGSTRTTLGEFSTETTQSIHIAIPRLIQTKFRNQVGVTNDAQVLILGSASNYSASFINCTENWLEFTGGQTGKNGDRIFFKTNGQNTASTDRTCTLRIAVESTTKDIVFKQAGTQPNNAPTVKTIIPNQTLALTGTPIVFDLNKMGVFNDADGDMLSMWQSYGQNVVTTLFDNVLVIYPKQVGTETLKVYAYDGINQVETSFVINVVEQSIPSTNINLRSDWNLVSVPLSVANPSPTNLFSTAIPNTLNAREGGQYVPKSFLEPYKAYWMKSSGAATANISGTPVNTCTITLEAGWNMISPPNCSLPISAAQVDAGILIANTLNQYNGVYNVVSQVEAGKAYWIKATTAGSMTLACGNTVLGKTEQTFTPDLSSFGVLTFRTSEGYEKALYFGGDLPQGVDPESFSMPPVAPSANGLDVRFGNNRYVQEATPETMIRLSAPQEIQVTLQRLPTKGRYSLQLANGVQKPLWIGKTISLPMGEHVRLLETYHDLPQSLALSQNFPNPFTHHTEIQYGLATDAVSVKMRVFDNLGRQIRSWQLGPHKAGYYRHLWDGNTQSGLPVATGVYIFEIEVAHQRLTKKITRIR